MGFGGGFIDAHIVNQHPRWELRGCVGLAGPEAAHSHVQDDEVLVVEDPLAEEIPEPANAEYLADATGRRPRNYSILGAYGRAWTVAIAVLVVVFIVLLALR